MYCRAMIEGLLQKLDFNKNETAVYLSILEHGKISPTRVSKLTGVNRTTVYGIAKKLSKLGVIVEDIGGKNHYLTALPTKSLRNIVSKEEEKLSSIKANVEEAIDGLSPLANKANFSVPKIRFVEENDLNDYFYKRTKDWLASAAEFDNTNWGYRDHTLLENYLDWIDYYWKIAPEDHVLKLLSNEADIENELQGKYPRRLNTYWNNVENFTLTTWVMGTYVIMVMTQQRPHYLIEINDPVFSKNQRELFKGIWKELKEKKR